MENKTFDEQVSIFLYIFFYELECSLNIRTEELKQISFQSEEANTDKEFKDYLKKHIAVNLRRLPPNKNENELNIVITNTDGKESNTFMYEDFFNFKITNIYLPDELPENYKIQLQNEKSSIYVKPDLSLEISDGNDKKMVTVELKSTKNDSIPGSSIQQITPTEWVVFIKHSKKELSVTTGQYMNAITETLQFPDRSPRPQVGFKKLLNWNNDNRKVFNNELIYSLNKIEFENKKLLLTDWQDFLAKRWLDIVFSSEIKNKEPWFNNALRKFAVRFLEKLEVYEAKDIKGLRDKVNSHIQYF